MKIIVFIGMLSCLVFLSANPAPVVNITNVTQRTDSSRKVDIYYKISHNTPVSISLHVSADNGVTWNIPCTLVTGDFGANISPGNGKHIVWDVVAEHPDMVNDYMVMVIAEDGQSDLPSDGLVAHYPLNGNAMDYSGMNNHGIIMGEVSFHSEDRFGIPHRAVYLNGLANNFIYALPADHIAFAGDFTISFWMNISYNPTNPNPAQYPLSLRRSIIVGHSNRVQSINFDFCDSDSGGKGYWLYVNSSGTNQIWGGHMTMYTDSQWHQVILVRRSGHMTLYIDNINKGSRSYSSSLGSECYTRIGSPDQNALGYVDDIRIYNRALVDSEIQALYHEGGWGL